MKLGAFSVSLNVKDIHVSKAFYEDLGFQTLGGDIEQNWLIMKNENSIIGLFQGMFEKNILTFNPGWDENAENLDSFTDIRAIQKQLKDKGIKMLNESDDTSDGPGHFTIEDPDGNQILLDQHRWVKRKDGSLRGLSEVLRKKNTTSRLILLVVLFSYLMQLLIAKFLIALEMKSHPPNDIIFYLSQKIHN